MNKLLEICCYSVQSVVNAQTSGAHRIELCSGLCEGGITPPHSTVMMARQKTDMPVNVMIRPRGGDFCYSNIEYEQMLLDIRLMKELDVNGIVLGILNDDGTIDMKRTEEAIGIAKPLSVTFHRAFDMSADLFDSLEKLIKLGVDRILTSGKKQTAREGRNLIRQLVEKADGRIKIMPGSGINAYNIAEIALCTGADEFHASARKVFPGQMKYRRDNISMNGSAYDEFCIVEADALLIKEMVGELNKI